MCQHSCYRHNFRAGDVYPADERNPTRSCCSHFDPSIQRDFLAQVKDIKKPQTNILKKGHIFKLGFEARFNQLLAKNFPKSTFARGGLDGVLTIQEQKTLFNNGLEIKTIDELSLLLL